MFSKIPYTLILFSLSIVMLHSQDISFTVEVTADTIYQGNAIKVKYTVENTQGDFVAPELDEWVLIGGPNTSSQFSMINGSVTQSASYEYILQAPMEGRYMIPEASLNNGEEIITTEPVWITVLPNPDGIQVVPHEYGFRQQINHQKSNTPLSSQDSLKLKLRKLKSVKI